MDGLGCVKGRDAGNRMTDGETEACLALMQQPAPSGEEEPLWATLGFSPMKDPAVALGYLDTSGKRQIARHKSEWSELPEDCCNSRIMRGQAEYAIPYGVQDPELKSLDVATLKGKQAFERKVQVGRLCTEEVRVGGRGNSKAPRWKLAGYGYAYRCWTSFSGSWDGAEAEFQTQLASFKASGSLLLPRPTWALQALAWPNFGSLVSLPPGRHRRADRRDGAPSGHRVRPVPGGALNGGVGFVAAGPVRQKQRQV